MAAQPILFTVAFRKKMAELPARERHEWLRSLAGKVASAPQSRDSVVWHELREVARGCRLSLVDKVIEQLGELEPRYLSALVEVPRERFVRPEDLEHSADDTPLSLDDEGRATISAPHAYFLSYRALGLAPGDTLVELGTGSGYGAALAAHIVGPDGRVLTFEIDERLAGWARQALTDEPNVRVEQSDAMASASQWAGARKVSVTFAVKSLPAAWLDALPERGMLVAPVGRGEGDQRLILATKTNGRIVEADHGAVRYVKNRSPVGR